MNLDEWAAAEIAATMRPCRELPYGDRVQKRASDRRDQREIEERRLINNVPEDVHSLVDETSTGSPEIGLPKQDKGAA